MTDAYKPGDKVEVRLNRRTDCPWLAGEVLHATAYEALVHDKARTEFFPLGMLRDSRIRPAGAEL